MLAMFCWLPPSSCFFRQAFPFYSSPDLSESPMLNLHFVDCIWHWITVLCYLFIVKVRAIIVIMVLMWAKICCLCCRQYKQVHKVSRLHLLVLSNSFSAWGLHTNQSLIFLCFTLLDLGSMCHQILWVRGAVRELVRSMWRRRRTTAINEMTAHCTCTRGKYLCSFAAQPLTGGRSVRKQLGGVVTATWPDELCPHGYLESWRL